MILDTTNPTRPRVLLVDDNEAFLEVTADALDSDFQVDVARNAEEIFQALRERRPEIILLDVMLASESGHEICRVLRGSPDTKKIPVIMISGHSSPSMEVEAFHAGANDFLSKPFQLPVLRARIQARTAESVGPVLKLGGLEMDLRSETAKMNGKAVYFSPTEFQLLVKLLESSGRPISRVEFCSTRGICPRNVDAHMVKIRRKIKGASLKIKSVYGKGYLIAPV